MLHEGAVNEIDEIVKTNIPHSQFAALRAAGYLCESGICSVSFSKQQHDCKFSSFNHFARWPFPTDKGAAKFASSAILNLLTTQLLISEAEQVRSIDHFLCTCSIPLLSHV
jgi:hypothetical protein